MSTPDWSLLFEIMCDARDYAIKVVLGQRHDNIFLAIYYASRILNDAQENYTTIKKMLAVVYSYDKFRPYIIESYTDHVAIRYLTLNKYAKPRLIRWVLLF